MINKMYTVLLVVMLTAVQPALAQSGVVTIDLGYATDEELTKALDVATELELIMRSDWEAVQLDSRSEFVPEKPILETEVAEPPVEVPADGFFEESRRLLALAEEAFERGDYEAATMYAQEAARYARLSEEEYIEIEADEEPVSSYARTETVVPDSDGYPLPATFTVRLWVVYGDSLWNIAALPEVYGDPYKWPILFEANRHNMPNPNNPDLIEPGMLLEIPSLAGELREGVWQSGRSYRRR